MVLGSYSIRFVGSCDVSIVVMKDLMRYARGLYFIGLLDGFIRMARGLYSIAP